MSQITKPELSKYLHAEIFIPTTASPPNAIKQGLMKTWPGITENFIKNHL